MARIRSIKIGFFKNEQLCALPMAARLLFAGLWVLADREGRLEDRPRRIKAELFPYEDVDVEDLLNKLASVGFIERYQLGQLALICLPTWKSHQKPHHKEPTSTLPGPKLKGAKKRHASVMHEPCMTPEESPSTVLTPSAPGADPVGSGSLSLGSGSRDLGNGEGVRTLALPTKRHDPLERHLGCDRSAIAACLYGGCIPKRVTEAWRNQCSARNENADTVIRAVVTVALESKPVIGNAFRFWEDEWTRQRGELRSTQPTKTQQAKAEVLRGLQRLAGGER